MKKYKVEYRIKNTNKTSDDYGVLQDHIVSFEYLDTAKKFYKTLFKRSDNYVVVGSPKLILE